MEDEKKLYFTCQDSNPKPPARILSAIPIRYSGAARQTATGVISNSKQVLFNSFAESTHPNLYIVYYNKPGHFLHIPYLFIIQRHPILYFR